MLGWVGLEVYWLAVFCMLLFLLGAIATDHVTYNFSQELITQKNFPWKKFQWLQMQNVILKDNFLTLDFTNNKIIQAEIKNENIPEKDFNAFVRKQLKKHPAN